MHLFDFGQSFIYSCFCFGINLLFILVGRVGKVYRLIFGRRPFEMRFFRLSFMTIVSNIAVKMLFIYLA